MSSKVSGGCSVIWNNAAPGVPDFNEALRVITQDNLGSKSESSNDPLFGAPHCLSSVHPWH
jgi:hypothetical protein